MVGFVRAVCHPPTAKDPDYDGPDIREDEVEAFTELMLNKPVCIEHDPDRVVGVVKSFSRGPKDEIICDILIDEDLEWGRSIMKDLWNREMHDVSFRIDVMPKREDSSIFERDSIEPIEISIVKEGAMENTKIIGFGDETKFQFLSPGLKAIYSSSQSTINNDDCETPTMQKIPAEHVPSADANERFAKIQKMLADKNLNDPDALNRLFEDSERFRQMEGERQKKQRMEFHEAVLKISPFIKDEIKENVFPKEFAETFTSGMDEVYNNDQARNATSPLVTVANSTIGKYRDLKAKYEERTSKMTELEKENSDLKSKLANYSGGVALTTKEERSVERDGGGGAGVFSSIRSALEKEFQEFARPNMSLMNSASGGAQEPPANITFEKLFEDAEMERVKPIVREGQRVEGV